MKQNKMKRIGLTPNKSYDIFILGDNIVNYLHLPHHMKSYDDQEMTIHIYAMILIILIISILKCGLKMVK